MDPELSVGSRIRRERDRQRLSLAQLADAAGLSKAYLVRLENDPDANPSLETLKKIADAMETTVADLIGRPRIVLDQENLEIPTSLRAFADEAGLTQKELEMLASIRWRGSDQPKTRERWRYVYDSLKASRQFDEER